MTGPQSQTSAPSMATEPNEQVRPVSPRVPEHVFRDLLAAAERVNRYHQAARSQHAS